MRMAQPAGRAAWGVLLLGALTIAAGPAAADREDIDRLADARESYRALRQDLLEALWSATVEGHDPDLASVYARAEAALHPAREESLAAIAARTPDPSVRAAASALRAALAAERARAGAVAAAEAALPGARGPTLQVTGVPLDLWSCLANLRIEVDASRRRFVYFASRDLLEAHNVHVLEWRRSVEGTAEPVVDAAGIDSLAARLLRETHDEYRELLAQAARVELGIVDLADLRAWDVPYLCRFGTLSAGLNLRRARDAVDRWMDDFGVPDWDAGLRLDLEARAGKLPEPFLVALGPRDRRGSVSGSGGLTDVRALLGVCGRVGGLAAALAPAEGKERAEETERTDGAEETERTDGAEETERTEGTEEAESTDGAEGTEATRAGVATSGTNASVAAAPIPSASVGPVLVVGVVDRLAAATIDESVLGGPGLAPGGPADLWGRLAQRALLDPAWRARYLDLAGETDLAAGRAFRLLDLMERRRAAARHLFARRAAVDPQAGPAAYAAGLEAALLWPHGPAEGLEHLTAGPADGSDLMGWAAADRLWLRLADRLGPRWPASPELGADLRRALGADFGPRGARSAD